MVDRAEGQSLEDYLNERVFSQAGGVTMTPVAEDVEGFRRYLKDYRALLTVERSAVEHI